MKKLDVLFAAFLMISLVSCPISIWAQASPATTNSVVEALSGRVVIRENGRPARGTRIWILEEKSGKQYSAQQNANGEFSITLPEGYYVVLVTNLGLIPYAKEIDLQHGRPIKLMVKLDPDWDIMQDIDQTK